MRKNGFTLIELLAVIVILAIIALITVPIVINIINDSKKESINRSVDLYIDHAQKAITKYQMTHPGFNPKECTIEDKKLTCDGTPIEVEMKGQVPESGTIIFNSNSKITYSVELEGMEYTLNNEGKKSAQLAPAKATREDYRGYYADVDGDGEADGVIYADLNKSESGQWSDSNGTFTYTAKTNLNEYTISNNKHNGNFGEKEIIKLKKEKNNPRFYVMALEDFTEGSMIEVDIGKYYWYYGAWGHMSPIITYIGFGKGYENTELMIEKWNAAGTNKGYVDSPQNDYDIWEHVESKFKKGWYIPSKEEWSAFGDWFTNKTDLETKLTTSNYSSVYELSDGYWSSSQLNSGGVWNVYFNSGTMGSCGIAGSRHVRLGITF